MATIAVWPVAAGAQVESHVPPADRPPALFPSWVTTLPCFECQEVSSPLARDKEKAKNTAGGRRDLSVAGPEASAPVDLAQAGKYREAAAAGGELLKLPSARYDDFTWDYVANAVAWSRLQLGDLRGAAQAHSAAVARIEDVAVRDYHRTAAAMLGAPGLAATQVKDPAAYRAELRKALANRIKVFERDIGLAKKNVTAAGRLRFIGQFYDDLRALTAADPETANGVPLAAFRELADGLVTDVVPAVLRDSVQRRDKLIALYSRLLFQRDIGDWNSGIKTMWSQIRIMKRLCRMHHYMVRLGLATGDDATRLFAEAHQLLFSPEDPSKVWQPIGYTRLIDNIPQLDLRCKVPYQETTVAPIGVTVLATGPTGVGWSRMGDMDGSAWNKMDDNSWDKMGNNGWGKMDGNGWGKMDSGRWGKMDSGRWGKM
ncbi:MAG: hypothetical protein IMZ66_09360, partial [Planctomycetes bacterium]|nr:hypothetical protein [Planctomycetota bacterium]